MIDFGPAADVTSEDKQLPPRLILRFGYIVLAELGPQAQQYIGSTVYYNSNVYALGIYV